jgi:ketosteroid isomerase-like protein
MSTQVELLRRGYEQLVAEGVPGIAHLLEPDFEVETASELPEAGTYRGREGFETLVATISEPFDEIRLDPEDFIEVGDDLFVVALRIYGRGRESGVALDTHVVHVWTMRGERASRLRVFTSRGRALEAIMRDAYEAFNRGDYQTIMSVLAPDVELHEEPELPDARVWHGPEGVATYFAEGTGLWQEFDLQVDEVTEVAEQVVVVMGVMRGSGGRSGAPVESSFGHVYELSDWKAARITFYLDRERALEASRSLTRPGQAP